MTDAHITALIDQLAAIPATDRLHNPYAPLDDPQAQIRRANFSRYLHKLRDIGPRFMLLAEAPGYRGCRWTGIPFTSERIILEQRDKWGIFDDGYHLTSDNPDGVSESSGTILWAALNDYCEIPPVIWNTVPLHPHKPGNPDSNRTPTVTEQRMGAPYIQTMLALFEVKTILAVGRKAQHTLTELELDYIPLRHPSQGGKADFIAGLQAAVKP